MLVSPKPPPSGRARLGRVEPDAVVGHQERELIRRRRPARTQAPPAPGSPGRASRRCAAPPGPPAARPQPCSPGSVGASPRAENVAASPVRRPNAATSSASASASERPSSGEGASPQTARRASASERPRQRPGLAHQPLRLGARRHQPLGGLELEGDRGQPLGQRVVDLAGQPVPLLGHAQLAGAGVQLGVLDRHRRRPARSPSPAEAAAR